MVSRRTRTAEGERKDFTPRVGALMRRLLISGFLLVVISMVLAACAAQSNSTQGGSVSPPQKQAQNCGKVQLNPRGLPVNATTAKQAINCFAQAFQNCQTSSLTYTVTSLDTGITRTFTIQRNGSQCVVKDAKQQYIVPRPPFPATTYTCTGVTKKTDGLHISSCGADGEVIISL